MEHKLVTDQVRFEQARNKIIGVDRQRLGIGTLSEKTVHAILKNYYEPDEDNQEIPIENYVADIYTDGQIIEIQTRNFNVMRDKLKAFLPLYPVTIVYPIPREKWLIWIDEETGELSTRRKSPKKGNPYMVFSELYKIKMFLKEERGEKEMQTKGYVDYIVEETKKILAIDSPSGFTKEVADFALDILDVDKLGLDISDRTLLLTLIQKFGGGPVGLDTLAAAIGEDSGTIEDVYEPYLIQHGFFYCSPRGRVATEFAYHHLGLE